MDKNAKPNEETTKERKRPGRKATGERPRHIITLPAEFVQWLDEKCGGRMKRTRFIITACHEYVERREDKQRWSAEERAAIEMQRKRVDAEKQKLAKMEQAQWDLLDKKTEN